MIVVRAPFRVSFVGGGTDFYDYYKLGYGNVISVTINKFIYVTLIKKFDGRVSLKYSKYECVDRAEELEHTLVREGLKMFGIEVGVEIDIISDIPARGSGLGSSSALACALLMAFAKYQGYDLNGYELAEKACELEIDILKEPIGKQDQYAACFGGFQGITFYADGRIKSCCYPKYLHRIKWLQDASMLFYLNRGRKSSNILDTHKREISNKRKILDVQRDLVKYFDEWLDRKRDNEYVGELVSESWQCKKIITPMATDDEINDIIFSALKAGACGAKVCGAGDGGFLLVICDPGKQNRIRDALKKLPELEFGFEWEGTKVIYNDD